MPKESRVKKTLLNVRINLICYFASLFVAFFTRKILLDSLGTEFIGLTGTLGSLLGFLNLAELGIGSAICYVLYKPIFNGDHSTINEIVSVFGYLYRWIGGIILGSGIILSLFLPLIFKDTNIPMYAIYAGFYAYLTSSMLGYFINYNSAVLTADQRNYIITGYNQLTTTIKVLIQMLLAMYVCSFVLYFVIELTFGIANCIILQWKMRKTYPWLHKEAGKGKTLLKKYHEIGTYTKQIFVHRIAGFVNFQLCSFLIYAFVSLPMVALYGNYLLVSQRLESLAYTVMGSSWSGTGNLIAEGNREKTYSIFCELQALQMLIIGFMVACIYVLIDDFIITWLGSEYQLSKVIVALICLRSFMVIASSKIGEFLNGYGLFYDVWSPLTEAAISVAASILFGSLFGLTGVLLGPIVSMAIITYGWRPYFLFSKGFHYPVIYFWVKFLRNLAVIVVAGIAAYLIYTPIMAAIGMQPGWGHWIVEAIIFSVLMGVLLFGGFYGFVPEFRQLALRFIKNGKHIM